jgi:hypothetical protein
MPDNDDTVNRALLENLSSREINALLNSRTPRQRRDIRALLSPRQRIHLKQWQREHPTSANPDQSFIGALLLVVVVLVVLAFVALLIFEFPHLKLFK